MTYKLVFTVTLAMILFHSSAWAKISLKSFQILGKRTLFIEEPEHRLLISQSCQKSKAYSCQSFNALKNVSLQNLKTTRQGGKNPGAIICASYPLARVVKGIDSTGNENSFCLFHDGSMVDSGTLFYYARENDAKDGR